MELIFYTREKCQLCLDAKLILQVLQSDHEFDIIEIDIDDSDELTERFGLMIPVIEIDGEIVQYGMIDPFAITEMFKK
jgi:glutaredoxin